MRAGKCTIGLNAVNTLKKAQVMIICKSISENSEKDAIKTAKKLKCRLYKSVENTLEEITHRENVKVLAITDKALGRAFTEHTEKDFVKILGDIKWLKTKKQQTHPTPISKG